MRGHCGWYFSSFWHWSKSESNLIEFSSPSPLCFPASRERVFTRLCWVGGWHTSENECSEKPQQNGGAGLWSYSVVRNRLYYHLPRIRSRPPKWRNGVVQEALPVIRVLELLPWTVGLPSLWQSNSDLLDFSKNRGVSLIHWPDIGSPAENEEDAQMVWCKILIRCKWRWCKNAGARPEGELADWRCMMHWCWPLPRRRGFAT